MPLSKMVSAVVCLHGFCESLANTHTFPLPSPAAPLPRHAGQRIMIAEHTDVSGIAAYDAERKEQARLRHEQMERERLEQEVAAGGSVPAVRLDSDGDDLEC